MKKIGIEKVWVTKYALSNGITRETVELNESDDGRIIAFAKVRGSFWLIPKGHWFRTREEAIRKAEEMRRKRIKSLRKQIEKLETQPIPIED